MCSRSSCRAWAQLQVQRCCCTLMHGWAAIPQLAAGKCPARLCLNNAPWDHHLTGMTDLMRAEPPSPAPPAPLKMSLGLWQWLWVAEGHLGSLLLSYQTSPDSPSWYQSHFNPEESREEILNELKGQNPWDLWCSQRFSSQPCPCVRAGWNPTLSHRRAGTVE